MWFAASLGLWEGERGGFHENPLVSLVSVQVMVEVRAVPGTSFFDSAIRQVYLLKFHQYVQAGCAGQYTVRVWWIVKAYICSSWLCTRARVNAR